MGKISKTSALFLALIVVTLILATLTVPASAQSIPKPTIPEFTLQYVAGGFDVPTTYKTDPYNGQKVVDQEGYHVDNSSIVIVIKNQPFDTNFNGLNYHLFYNVRFKGHFAQDWEWTTQYSSGNFTLLTINPKQDYTPRFLEQTSDEFTTASYLTTAFPADAEIDIQVKASLNYEGKIKVYYDAFDAYGFMIDGYILDQESEWSSTKTIHLLDGSVSASSNPTVTSNFPAVSTAPTTPTFAENDQAGSGVVLPLTSIVFIVILTGALASAVSTLVYRKWAGRATHG